MRKASSGTAHGVPACCVKTFCTVSRRPVGPLAPPPRRARLRSRWRFRYGGANAGRQARTAWNPGRLTYSKFHLVGGTSLLPLPGLSRGRAEPVKAVCDRRTTAPAELPGERTREDGLDRTCPDLELAAIESRDTSGQGPLTLNRQRRYGAKVMLKRQARSRPSQ